MNKELVEDDEDEPSEEHQMIIPEKIGPTVSAMMKNYLADHKMDVPLLNAFA